MGHDVKVKGILEVTLGPRSKKTYVWFPLGIQEHRWDGNKGVVQGQKVKITHEVISKML